MSEILQMKSVPILNSTDLYQYFDVFDMLRSREAFARFAAGHFRWSRSINLHHLDVILAMTDADIKFQMKSADDYWAFQGEWGGKSFESIDQYRELPEYEKQAETAALIYQKYAPVLKENDSKMLMLVTAGVLLAGKDEHCLTGISVGQLKRAYDRAEHFSDDAGSKEGSVIDIRLGGGRNSVSLPAFHGVYRIHMDPALQPSREKRMQTYRIKADADVDLECVDSGTGEVKRRRILAGEQIYALGIDGIISRILPNRVVNGENEMVRKADGIYLNDRRCFAIPDGVSSFAVGRERGVSQYIYVKDGHIHYCNYDHLEGKQKVSEEIAVISEVRIDGGEVTVLRNDGKVWDGRHFS